MRNALGLSLVVAILAASPVAADDAALAAIDERQRPAWLLEVPDSVTDILVADTGNATMHRFARAGEDIIEIDRRYMSIGQKGPGKERAWDKRPTTATTATGRSGSKR